MVFLWFSYGLPDGIPVNPMEKNLPPLLMAQCRSRKALSPPRHAARQAWPQQQLTDLALGRAGKRLRFTGKTRGKPWENTGVMKKNGKKGKTMGNYLLPSGKLTYL